MKKLNAQEDYPLYEKHPDLIKTPTNKSVDDINLENVLSGAVMPDDCRISADTLEYHAQIEESIHNFQVADNLRRAAEMTRIPDHRIMEIYNILRPRRSAKKDLIAIADELERKYSAPLNAAFIREAIYVYERRNIFRND